MKENKIKLFETIRIQDGEAQHLNYHNQRFNHTRKTLFGIEESVDLAEYLEHIPPKGLYRAKVIYDDKEIQTYYTIYKAKKIAHIKLIEAQIDYPYKALDRSSIDRLLEYCPDHDEILITRNGLLTDTSIANIALRQKSIWYTPIAPLLPGTTRARLLDEGKLSLRDIHIESLSDYDGLALMNAMIGFDELSDWQSLCKEIKCP